MIPTPHPQRLALANEVHARPPEPMRAPLTLSHIVMVCDAAGREASRQHLAALLRDHHLPPPDEHTNHLRVDLGLFRLRWELHTEFVAWTFSRPLAPESVATSEPVQALSAVSQDWLAALPGQCLVSLGVWVVPRHAVGAAAWARSVLLEDSLVGSSVAEGQAEVYTDFRVHPDGGSRLVVLTGSLTPIALGRLVQQLIEIDTYRMAALLGLPAAREAGATLASAEGELAQLAEAIRSAGRHDEPRLLDLLTQLAGRVESQYAATHSRFSASSAYFELVDKRIADIGETRVAGHQTLGEFLGRRLAPARSTCAWAARRQDALSQRVSRMSNLLRTRVEIEQQQSSKDLLAAMNDRQGLQLKLQSTVEGLSVAAITYYIVGLVNYLAKGARAWGWPLAPDTTSALAIPVVALAVWASLRRLHHRVFKA